MVEERIEIQGTPERNKPEVGNLRRNSTGKASKNSEEKILPHYLRASTSSCHEFCKYGRKHSFAAKEKRPILKRITAKRDEDQDPIKSEIIAVRKKKSLVRLDPSPDPKTLIPEPDKPQVIKRNVSAFVKKKILPAKQASSPVKRTDLPAKQNSSPARKTNLPLKHASSPARKTNLPLKHASSPAQKPNLPVKHASSPAQKTNLPVKHASSPAKKIVASSKPPSGLKPKPIPSKISSSPLNSLGGLNVRKNNDTKIVKKTANPKVGEKKVLVPPKASFSPKPYVKRVLSLNIRQHRNIKAISPLKNQIKKKKSESKPPNHASVKEKILYIIEPKPENRNAEPTSNGTISLQLSPSLTPSSSSISSTPQSFPSVSSHEEEEVGEEYSSVSEYEETENEEEIETSKLEENRRPRRSGLDHKEDKDCPPHKLNFRRGRVLSFKTESNVPRRLKFRRGRVLGENQIGKGDAGRRSFRRRIGGNDPNGTKSESEKVVLRHQDVQGKKGSQGLFNNVIEETASKLVETRKSKVKALVGAFETVISLQEGKPTSPKSG